MMTIRERDAEGGPEKIPASWQGAIPWAIEDRHALLVAGDALAEKAGYAMVTLHHILHPDSDPSMECDQAPCPENRAALARWHEVTG